MIFKAMIFNSFGSVFFRICILFFNIAAKKTGSENAINVHVAANEHQGSMKYQENRDRRKMPTKSREYITGT